MDEGVDQWGWDELLPELQAILDEPRLTNWNSKVLDRARRLWYEEDCRHAFRTRMYCAARTAFEECFPPGPLYAWPTDAP